MTLHYETPAGYTTIKTFTDPKEAVKFAADFSRETGRVTTLKYCAGNRYKVLVRVK